MSNTIWITAAIYRDAINGNSYFSSVAFVSTAGGRSAHVTVPFQYGYGDMYLSSTLEALHSAGLIPATGRYELERMGWVIGAHAIASSKRDALTLAESVVSAS